MDQNTLVTTGHELIDLLESRGVKPLAAVWVHNSETDTWKLWLVPKKQFSDQREFYRHIAEIISENNAYFKGLDPSDTEMVSSDHPAIAALRSMFHVSQRSSISLSSTMLNGFYLPDGIILLMDFPQTRRKAV